MNKSKIFFHGPLITAAQRTKLELKLEQFEALEELMEEEAVPRRNPPNAAS